MKNIEGLGEKCLIKNTSKRQREKIVNEVKNIAVNCGMKTECRMKYFQLYIDGEKELNEIFNMYINDLRGEDENGGSI